MTPCRPPPASLEALDVGLDPFPEHSPMSRIESTREKEDAYFNSVIELGRETVRPGSRHAAR